MAESLLPMADRPAYERLPYLTELETEVTSIGESDGSPFAILRDTLFYPEGGGQPADQGRLNAIRVIDVQRSEAGVRHFLEAPTVTGAADLKLDWKRRYDHMQQHTAQHLLSAIAAERFGWNTTSFHLGARQCDIELDTSEVEPEALAALEDQVMEAVRAARPVTARRVAPEEYAALEIRTRGLPESHAGDVRLVEIEGLDVTTCGGTHLRSTAEIEAMRLGPTEALRGGVRLYWLAGGRLRRRLAQLESRNHHLRRLFETSGEELVETARARIGTLKETARALRRANEELAEARAGALALDPHPVVEAHFEDVDGGFLQRLARRLVEQAPTKTVLLTSSGDSGLLFLVASGAASGIEAGVVGPDVADILGGRGGGSGAVFQGKAPASDKTPEAVRLLEALASGNA